MTAAVDTRNVLVAVTGAVYVAPKGSPAPTSVSSVLAPAWKPLGYISEDGVVEEHDMENEETKAWQNSDVVRKTVTKYGVSYKLTAIETNATVVMAYYSLTGGGGSSQSSPFTSGYTPTYGVAATLSSISEHVIGKRSDTDMALIVDVVDGSSLVRRYAPSVTITPDGEVSLTASEAIGYPMRFDCQPHPSIDGSVVSFCSAIR